MDNTARQSITHQQSHLNNVRLAADRFINGHIIIALKVLEHLAKVSADLGSIDSMRCFTRF